MKSHKRTQGKLKLEKIQISKINNLIAIKGGDEGGPRTSDVSKNLFNTPL